MTPPHAPPPLRVDGREAGSAPAAPGCASPPLPRAGDDSARTAPQESGDPTPSPSAELPPAELGLPEVPDLRTPRSPGEGRGPVVQRKSRSAGRTEAMALAIAPVPPAAPSPLPEVPASRKPAGAEPEQAGLPVLPDTAAAEARGRIAIRPAPVPEPAPRGSGDPRGPSPAHRRAGQSAMRAETPPAPVRSGPGSAAGPAHPPLRGRRPMPERPGSRAAIGGEGRSAAGSTSTSCGTAPVGQPAMASPSPARPAPATATTDGIEAATAPRPSAAEAAPPAPAIAQRPKARNAPGLASPPERGAAMPATRSDATRSPVSGESRLAGDPGPSTVPRPAVAPVACAPARRQAGPNARARAMSAAVAPVVEPGLSGPPPPTFPLAPVSPPPRGAARTQPRAVESHAPGGVEAAAGAKAKASGGDSPLPGARPGRVDGEASIDPCPSASASPVQLRRPVPTGGEIGADPLRADLEAASSARMPQPLAPTLETSSGIVQAKSVERKGRRRSASISPLRLDAPTAERFGPAAAETLSAQRSAQPERQPDRALLPARIEAAADSAGGAAPLRPAPAAHEARLADQVSRGKPSRPSPRQPLASAAPNSAEAAIPAGPEAGAKGLNPKAGRRPATPSLARDAGAQPAGPARRRTEPEGALASPPAASRTRLEAAAAGRSDSPMAAAVPPAALAPLAALASAAAGTPPAPGGDIGTSPIEPVAEASFAKSAPEAPAAGGAREGAQESSVAKAGGMASPSTARIAESGADTPVRQSPSLAGGATTAGGAAAFLAPDGAGISGPPLAAAAERLAAAQAAPAMGRRIAPEASAPIQRKAAGTTHFLLPAQAPSRTMRTSSGLTPVGASGAKPGARIAARSAKRDRHAPRSHGPDAPSLARRLDARAAQAEAVGSRKRSSRSPRRGFEPPPAGARVRAEGLEDPATGRAQAAAARTGARRIPRPRTHPQSGDSGQGANAPATPERAAPPARGAPGRARRDPQARHSGILVPGPEAGGRIERGDPAAAGDLPAGRAESGRRATARTELAHPGQPNSAASSPRLGGAASSRAITPAVAVAPTRTDVRAPGRTSAPGRATAASESSSAVPSTARAVPPKRAASPVSPPAVPAARQRGLARAVAAGGEPRPALAAPPRGSSAAGAADPKRTDLAPGGAPAPTLAAGAARSPSAVPSKALAAPNRAASPASPPAESAARQRGLARAATAGAGAAAPLAASSRRSSGPGATDPERTVLAPGGAPAPTLAAGAAESAAPATGRVAPLKRAASPAGPALRRRGPARATEAAAEPSPALPPSSPRAVAAVTAVATARTDEMARGRGLVPDPVAVARSASAASSEMLTSMHRAASPPPPPAAAAARNTDRESAAAVQAGPRRSPAVPPLRAEPAPVGPEAARDEARGAIGRTAASQPFSATPREKPPAGTNGAASPPAAPAIASPGREAGVARLAAGAERIAEAESRPAPAPLPTLPLSYPRPASTVAGDSAIYGSAARPGPGLEPPSADAAAQPRQPAAPAAARTPLARAGSPAPVANQADGNPPAGAAAAAIAAYLDRYPSALRTTAPAAAPVSLRPDHRPNARGSRAETDQAASAVQIHIGRIRIDGPPAPQPSRGRFARPRPALGLAAYIDNRRGS
jgi:hypothetical protein